MEQMNLGLTEISQEVFQMINRFVKFFVYRVLIKTLIATSENSFQVAFHKLDYNLRSIAETIVPIIKWILKPSDQIIHFVKAI